MAEGLSFRSFAGLIGTTYKTLYNWCDNYPEFLHAKESATAKCLLYDEKLLKKGAEGTQRGYNIAAHKWKMANIHKWSEKIETDNSTTVNIVIDSDDSKL